MARAAEQGTAVEPDQDGNRARRIWDVEVEFDVEAVDVRVCERFGRGGHGFWRMDEGRRRDVYPMQRMVSFVAHFGFISGHAIFVVCKSMEMLRKQQRAGSPEPAREGD